MRAEGVERLSYLSEVRADAASDLEDTEADFQKIFLTHHGRIVALLFRMVGDHTRAEELASDVFWKVSQLPPSAAKENVGGWLYRTAANLGIGDLRARARRQRYERDAARDAAGDTDSESALDQVLRAEQRVRVRSVLASLKPLRAQLLILRSSGFSYKELADVLRVKMNSVGTRLARAEAEFHKRYFQLYGREE